MGFRITQFKTSLRITFYFLVLLWVVHLVQVILNINFFQYGVIPGQISGLKGVFTAPLIHGNFAHLAGNSVPLMVLMVILFFFYQRQAIPTFFAIYLGAGVLVWLFSPSRNSHIGASGIVYGLVAFVFWMGLFSRNVNSIALAMIVLLLYSGLFEGIFPTMEGVSWETHLFGALIGIGMAFLFRKSIGNDEEENEEEDPPKKFFEEKTFEKDKKENWTSNLPDWNSNSTW